jgi:pyruvate-formate lyase
MDLEHLQHTYKVMRKVLETHAKRGSRAALKEMAQAFDLTEEDAMQNLRRAAQRLYQW